MCNTQWQYLVEEGYALVLDEMQDGEQVFLENNNNIKDIEQNYIHTYINM